MPAVRGLIRIHIQNVDNVFVSGVGEDVHVIPRPLPEAVAEIHEVPSLAAIFGTVQAAIGIARLNQGVDPIGIGADGDADASIGALGQAMLLQSLPGRARVVRTVKSASWTAVGETPWAAPSLPERGKQNVRIAGIEGHVDASRVLILIENFLPVLAAIDCAENAAFDVGSIGMAEGGHENDVGIIRIDD